MCCMCFVDVGGIDLSCVSLLFQLPLPWLLSGLLLGHEHWVSCSHAQGARDGHALSV